MSPAPAAPPAAARCPLRPPQAPRRRPGSGCSHRRPPLSRARRLPGSPRRGGTKLCLSFQLRQSFWEKSSLRLENKSLARSHAQQRRRVPAEAAVAEVLGRAPVRQRQAHCGFLVGEFWISRLGLGLSSRNPSRKFPRMGCNTPWRSCKACGRAGSGGRRFGSRLRCKNTNLFLCPYEKGTTTA